MTQMRFHVFALPHTQTTSAYLACAYTAKVINFCRMMKERGHIVILYAGEQNEAPCDELVTCISEVDRAEAQGNLPFTSVPLGSHLPHWQKFNGAAIRELASRVKADDFLCVIGGHAHKPIADSYPSLMTVEFGVGYSGVFSDYRVFESYAWMHMNYGAKAQRDGGDTAATPGDGRFFDAVIPGYLDPAMFPLRTEKDDYFLFIGRLIERKGCDIAAEACRRLGERLIVAGTGDPPSGAEWVGTVGPEERSMLMGGARAVFVPSRYVEPFGNVAIEAQACGTPVITTDFGAFTETVEDGVTGFRCHTLGEFMAAARNVARLDPIYIHERAVRLYSLDRVGALYEKYFRRLSLLKADGWYSEQEL